MSEEEILTIASLLVAAEKWEDVLRLLLPRREEGPMGHALTWNAGFALLKLGRAEEAATLLREAIDGGPPSHAYFGALGLALLELDERELAELWLLRALAVREGTLGRRGLGVCYQRQGLFDMAEAVFKEGIRLRPGDAEAAGAYADFLDDMGREDAAEAVRKG